LCEGAREDTLKKSHFQGEGKTPFVLFGSTKGGGGKETAKGKKKDSFWSLYHKTLGGKREERGDPSTSFWTERDIEKKEGIFMIPFF